MSSSRSSDEIVSSNDIFDFDGRNSCAPFNDLGSLIFITEMVSVNNYSVKRCS